MKLHYFVRVHNFFLYLWIIHVGLMSVCFFLKAKVAAGALKVSAAGPHGASGAARILSAPSPQRACFSTSTYEAKVGPCAVDF